MPIQPKVLIVILNYGTYEMTINLIRELQADLEYDNYSIMVVDNYSPNESAEVLKSKSNELNYIFYANKTNAGYAAGNNIGIRYGITHGFDYTWILNNDVELREKNILSHMVESAEKKDCVGCVGPVIHSSFGKICAPYVNRPTFWSMTLGIAFEKKFRLKFINTSRKVYRVYGCCMLLKNRVMAEVDCMDERTFLYCEEDILAERMLKKGYVSYYDAEVSITHRESASVKYASEKNSKIKMIETQNSMEIYLKEYRHFSLWKRFLCKFIRNMINCR